MKISKTIILVGILFVIAYFLLYALESTTKKVTE